MRMIYVIDLNKLINLLIRWSTPDLVVFFLFVCVFVLLFMELTAVDVV